MFLFRVSQNLPILQGQSHGSSHRCERVLTGRQQEAAAAHLRLNILASAADVEQDWRDLHTLTPCEQCEPRV